MRTIYFLCICLLFIQFSCTTNPTNEVNSTAIDIDGFWIGSLHIYPNKTIPFNFKVSGDTVHFYNAEEYHHNYFEKNPLNGYCNMVVRPKVEKFRNENK